MDTNQRKTCVAKQWFVRTSVEHWKNVQFGCLTVLQPSKQMAVHPDCLLKPVNIFPDPHRINGYLVMCEVLNADGTPHRTNGRATIDDDDDDFWFGFEQEYFIMDVDTQLPLGFPVGGYQTPQGLYYCSVGGKTPRSFPHHRSPP